MQIPQPKRPVYIAIDLKSYYASVECVERGLNPLTTNLLVADETRSDKTICLAVSPSLKAMGVPSRPRLFEAKQAIKLYEAQQHTKVEYIIAKPQMALYEKVSTKICFRQEDRSPFVHPEARRCRWQPASRLCAAGLLHGLQRAGKGGAITEGASGDQAEVWSDRTPRHHEGKEYAGRRDCPRTEPANRRSSCLNEQWEVI